MNTDTLAADHIACEGSLVKRSNKWPHPWQRRYFILGRNALEYYRKSTDTEPLGKIKLKGGNVEIATQMGNKEHAFTVIDGETKREYYLAADSKKEAEYWTNQIQRILLYITFENAGLTDAFTLGAAGVRMSLPRNRNATPSIAGESTRKRNSICPTSTSTSSTSSTSQQLPPTIKTSKINNIQESSPSSPRQPTLPGVASRVTKEIRRKSVTFFRRRSRSNPPLSPLAHHRRN